MEINLKDTLRSLRLNKNVTQEALANHLGITPQSVGKWERGEGFPDIMLLPNIALYFDVTVDELLNVGRARIDEKIKLYQEESHKYQNAGESEKVVALWEKAYQEFPNEDRVMGGLLNALCFNNHNHTKESAERIIALGERILDESKDNEIRESAVQLMCYTYSNIGDNENAVRYANMGGSMFCTRDDLRSTVLRGEEGIAETQWYIESLFNLAYCAASAMLGKGDFSDEERIEVLKFKIDLWKLLYSDGNVGFFSGYISDTYSTMAFVYAKTQNVEKTLSSLENASEYAVIHANLGEMQYTAPMVNRLKHRPENTTQNYKGNACNLRLRSLSHNIYDFLRDDERFKTIEAKLRKYAE